MPNDTNSKPNQPELDFRRGRQLAALRSAVLPKVKVDAKNVSPRTMKAVLMAIDSRAGKSGECWAAAATLAADCGICTRSAERALAGLKLIDLVIETPVRRGRANCLDRRICFANLIDHEPGELDQSDTFTPQPLRDEPNVHTATGAVHTATGAVHTATVARSHRNGCGQRERKGNSKDPLKGNSPPAKNGFIEMIKGKGITIDDLIDPDFLDKMFDAVVAAGLVPESDAARLAFFGFGCRCYRNRKQLINPQGFFVKGLSKGLDWLLGQVDDAHDRNQASKLIKRLRGDLETRTADLLPTEGRTESDELRTFEAERERQRAALVAEYGGKN